MQCVCDNDQQDAQLITLIETNRDRSITVVKVLCYKSEVRWFDPG